jgi:hypothetical protein
VGVAILLSRLTANSLLMEMPQDAHLPEMSCLV